MKLLTKTLSTDDGTLAAWLSQDGQPEKVSISTTPSAMVGRNRDWIYACSQKIATVISQVPIHVYATVPAGRSLISRHLPVNEVLRKSIVKAARKTQAVQVVELEDHPLRRLFELPQEGVAWQSWIGVQSSYLSLTGNGYAIVAKDAQGKPVELKLVRAEYVEVVIDQTANRIKEYRVSDPNGRPFVAQPDSVLHLKDLTAGSTLIGQGWAEKVAKKEALMNDVDDHLIALANNLGQVGGMWILKNPKPSQKEANDFVEYIKRKFTRGGRGKPMAFAGRDVEYQATEVLSPKNMVYSEHLNWSKKTICAVSGVPEDLVDTADSNRASSVVATNAFRRYCILPKLGAILSQINESVVAPAYGPDIWVWYDGQEALESDPVEQAAVATQYLSAGVLTVDEVRAALGRPPLGGQNEG